jgi:hypothetical protein
MSYVESVHSRVQEKTEHYCIYIALNKRKSDTGGKKLTPWVFKDEFIQKTLTGGKDSSFITLVKCYFSALMLTFYWIMSLISSNPKWDTLFDDNAIYSHVEIIDMRKTSYSVTIMDGVRAIACKQNTSDRYDCFWKIALSKDRYEAVISFLDSKINERSPFDAMGYTWNYLPHFMIKIMMMCGFSFPASFKSFTCSSLVCCCLIEAGLTHECFRDVTCGYKRKESQTIDDITEYTVNPFITSPQLIHVLLMDMKSQGLPVMITHNPSAAKHKVKRF